MPVHHVPKGFHSVTPYLTVESAEQLIEFVLKTFDAKEMHRTRDQKGRISHAQVLVEGSMIELSDGSPEWPPLRAALHVYVPDVDATYKKALAAGATSLFEPKDMFYGERGAGVRDGNGINWYLATHTEELSEEELKRRMAAAGEH